MLDQEQGGRFFRTAWITGVQKHYSGTPKEGYVKPWEQMDAWEQQSAIAVYQQVAHFLTAGVQEGKQTSLTKVQGGQLVRIAWVGQIYKHIPNPKPSYVGDWDTMPTWEQEVDADIFTAIEESVHAREATVTKRDTL